jgi:hypothetical protein
MCGVWPSQYREPTNVSVWAPLRKTLMCRTDVTPNPSIERTSQRPLRALWSTAHVER